MIGRLRRAWNGRPGWTAWVIWLGALAATAALLLTMRGRLDKAHVALAFLVVVLGGSAAAGRVLGLTLAGLAFLAFNFLFLPPYHTLVIANPLDWIVLASFLIVSVVAAQLLTRAQERAEVARQRAIEVERLATLGAETLNVGRAQEALGRIVEVIRSALGVECCEILVRPEPPWHHPGTTVPSSAPVSAARAGSCGGDPVRPDRPSAPGAGVASLAEWVLTNGSPAAQRTDGTTWIGTGASDGPPVDWRPLSSGASAILTPLVVRERTVGVLRIADPAIELDAAQQQFLSALSYYAALGVERARLVAEAERAEAFRQADALKSAVIAGLSHDLRTPLTTIKALANALREQGSPEAASIEDEADRLNRLVADLLDLSRLNAGAMPIRRELNTADDLIGAALQRATPALHGRLVAVTSVAASNAGTDDPLLVGQFDFVQSLRALVNLIENADKYSPAGEAIELSVAGKPGVLEFRVSDRGSGVSEAERDRIFEPFYRGPGAPPDVGGAGLGLAIARRLAVEQGGSVRHEPRAGGGSVFILTLPAADDGSGTPPDGFEAPTARD